MGIGELRVSNETMLTISGSTCPGLSGSPVIYKNKVIGLINGEISEILIKNYW